MSRKAALLILIVFVAAMLAGCQSVIHETDPADSSVESISPVPSDTMSNDISVNLYYGFGSDEFLVPDTKTISLSMNDDAPVAVLRALINKSDNLSSEYTKLINPDTKVVDIKNNDGYLFVTLSRDFLEVPENFRSAEMTESTRRYLAAYSVVNTLIEYGGFYRVQILVDRDGTGSGTPVTNAECGLSGDEYFEPHAYNSNIILNAENTTRQILKALEEKNWSMLYMLVARYNASNEARPSADDFSSFMLSKNPTISDVALVGSAEPVNISEQTMFVTFSGSIDQENTVSVTNASVKLIREHGIWKITYDELVRVFIDYIS